MFSRPRRRKLNYSTDDIDTTDDIEFANCDNNCLHVASMKGIVETVRLLLNDTNKNSVCKYHSLTALHLAAYAGHLDIVNLLIARGADVNAKSRSLMTPLHYSAMHGKSKTVRCLVSAGSVLDGLDFFGHSAVYYAAMDGHRNTLKLLLSLGAEINVLDKERSSIIQKLMCLNKYTMIRTLVEYKQQRLVSFIGCTQIYQLYVVRQRHRCDYLDFLIMDGDLDISEELMSMMQCLAPMVLNFHSDYEIFKHILDYDYNGHFISSQAITANNENILLNHYVRMFVLKPDRSSRQSSNRLKELFENRKQEIWVDLLIKRCNSELEEMKGMMFGDSSFTMYKILVGDMNVAFRCVRGLGIKVIREIDFKKAPVYGGMVQCKLKRMFRRVMLIDQLKNVCTEPTFLLQLPEVVLENIISFLSDTDLELLVKTTTYQVPLSFDFGGELWDFNKFCLPF